MSGRAPRCQGKTAEPKRCRKRTRDSDGFCQLHKPSPPSQSAPPESAPPESAPPESAPPESAQPESAPPESAQPESALSGEHPDSSPVTNEITESLTENLPASPAKQVWSSGLHSTPLNAVRGSQIVDDANARRFPMAADLAYRSYISEELLESFREGIPLVTQEHVSELKEKDEWKNFIKKCTGRGQSGSNKSSESNEEEFKALIQCIIGLRILEKYCEVSKENVDNHRYDRVRISHQGNCRMTTWNPQAKWLKGNAGSTARQKELKPDLMSVLVEEVSERRPRKAQKKYVRFAIPETITPPPNDWHPTPMEDKYFPIVECKDPVWECLDVFWECKRNSEALKNANVYIDCALKAAEALRYQWSRRFIYCFLHCGTQMQLLLFDRSGLMASKAIDIETDTATFIQCLLGVFWHPPSLLGYPSGKDAPFHKHDPDNHLRQVVTVNGRQLYLRDQEAGPFRDHLVSRATVIFRAKLVEPRENEKRGWDWCYKNSWAQIARRHEGECLDRVHDLPNVVSMLTYSIIKVDNNNDTTAFGRQCQSGDPITVLQTLLEKAKRGKPNFTQHSGTAAPGQQGLKAELYDPRRPEGGLLPQCDNREHRDIVTSWVDSSFDEAVESLASSPDSVSATLRIWKQAFTAVKSITDRGIVHRDISFRNVRIDDQQQLKICDFDMAMFCNDETSGTDDRTGTIAFMAAAILSSEPPMHRPVHDCESVFWLCALELLCKIGIGDTARAITNIMDSGSGMDTVSFAKENLINKLGSIKEFTPRVRSVFQLDNPKDRLLFTCLIALSRQLTENNHQWDYEQGRKGGFEDVCFDRCIESVQAADQGAGQAT